jgi:hypothetical protein
LVDSVERCSNFPRLLFDVYVWLNMLRAPLRPSSGACNCTRSFWFYRWSVVIADQQHCYHHALTIKPEAVTAVVELLMMGVRTPETC